MQESFPPTFDGLLQICARLRAPGGCPWDREQTRDSLKKQILEETYELFEAIDENDAAKIVEEMGDVLLHMVFQVQIGVEEGSFTPDQVFAANIDKLIRRHPHVFGDVRVSGSDEVLSRWQEMKRKEKEARGESLLDGVPKDLPALSYAQSIQERAARVGFDWDSIKGVLDKVREEIDELEAATTKEEREAEMGDVLFSLVNVSRWLKIDAEGTLRGTGAKFRRRFETMERLARERGLAFKELSMDKKEALWMEAKRTVG
ncbi:MAG: nucleoside triphosphate pyrophosphohydrolase [SAR202 cluster bacterium]|nr:nucleoside triphosphate pyrophosphohydrolase [SAR202 cluster bacterium]